MNKMIEAINLKLHHLKTELKAIDYTNNIDNLTLNKYDSRRRFEIIVKIQLLNELLILS